MQQQKHNTLVSLLNKNLFIGIVITKVKGLSLLLSHSQILCPCYLSLSPSLSLSLTHTHTPSGRFKLFVLALFLSRSLSVIGLAMFLYPNETVLS